MERPVMAMLELEFFQSFVATNRSVADDLDLRNSRDRVQVRVQDCLLGLLVVISVSILLGGSIECLRVSASLQRAISEFRRRQLTLTKSYCSSGVSLTSRNKRMSCFAYGQSDNTSRMIWPSLLSYPV